MELEMATNQNQMIKNAMIRLMREGKYTKDDLYDHCEKVMGYPRPTVRRVARDLRIELQSQVDILSRDIGKNGTS